MHLAAKNVIQELRELSRIQSTAASGASQSGVRTASRNHPSSRAGDQDDVSYKQTPSNTYIHVYSKQKKHAKIGPQITKKT